ncbi:putative quinol monooxygenase [Nitratireductor sp. GCM10026969]|uniref:putative quinol monooxygenase n=1 Tax=Nitratireductor sp. GCM10026969 TaxID=3252645 RepID=UPI00361846E5
MFGLIGKMRAQPGRRVALIALLLDSSGEMPGCLSYVIAGDEQDEDAIWITEVWESEESHKAALSLPGVRAAIEEARPLIAGFEMHIRTVPMGGTGLPPAPRGS